MKIHFLIAAVLAIAVGQAFHSNGSWAQGVGNSDTEDQAMLFDSFDQRPSSASDYRTTTPKSVAELRQARALYRSQQQIARLEHQLWMGYSPLRPTWNSTPMITGRYPASHTIFVPVYIRN